MIHLAVLRFNEYDLSDPMHGVPGRGRPTVTAAGRSCPPGGQEGVQAGEPAVTVCGHRVQSPYKLTEKTEVFLNTVHAVTIDQR